MLSLTCMVKSIESSPPVLSANLSTDLQLSVLPMILQSLPTSVGKKEEDFCYKRFFVLLKKIIKKESTFLAKKAKC